MTVQAATLSSASASASSPVNTKSSSASSTPYSSAPAPASASTYVKPTPQNAHSYKPTHPGLLKVVIQGGQNAQGEDSYSSFLVAEKDFPPNTVIASLTGLTSGPKAYSSVQYGPGPSDHFELNSDLLFINHSCKPNVGFDLSAPRTSTADYPREWHIKTLARGLQAGDALTFFYPSTEWDMQQGFNCQCGEKECLGMIKGAKHLKREQLDAQEWINPHILKLKDEQRGLTKE